MRRGAGMALSNVIVCLLSMVVGDTAFFSVFYWRISRLRYFVGCFLGTSRIKHQPLAVAQPCR